MSLSSPSSSSSSSKRTGTRGIYNGPLTSTFTPPASCNYLTIFSGRPRYLTLSQNIVSSSETVRRAITTITRISTGLGKFSYESDPGCYPPHHGTSKSVYYSPGVCPKDWVGARTRSTDSETTIFCCPQSFAVNVDDGAIEPQCLSSIVAETTTSVIIYREGTRVAGEPTITEVNKRLVYADGIQVRFHPSDFENSSARPPTQTTSPPDPSPSSSSGGLSTGAKIGIGIGVPFAAIALAALIFIIIWRRRRQQNKALSSGPPAEQGGAKHGDYAVAQYPDNSPSRLAELDDPRGNTRVRNNAAAAHEMAQPTVVHEVSGDHSWRSGVGQSPNPVELYSAPVGKSP